MLGNLLQTYMIIAIIPNSTPFIKILYLVQPNQAAVPDSRCTTLKTTFKLPYIATSPAFLELLRIARVKKAPSSTRGRDTTKNTHIQMYLVFPPRLQPGLANQALHLNQISSFFFSIIPLPFTFRLLAYTYRHIMHRILLQLLSVVVFVK